MSDEEYDKLLQYAEEQEWLKQDEVINDGANIVIDKMITHNIPMLSLAKAKSLNELKSFLKRINEKTNTNNEFVIEPKLDGLAITLKYENKKLIGAYTRGNGIQGEDASYIIDNKDLSVSNIHKELNDNISEIRGELVCSKENLIYNNNQRGEDFKNERIAASGLLKKSKLGLNYKAKLDFVAYSAYDDKGNELTIPYYTAKTDFQIDSFTINDDIEMILNNADIKRQVYQFPTDGIVIKMKTPKNLGETGHHPLNAVAYKYPSQSKISKVNSVIYQVGKTGKITPVAIIEPIEIDNVKIERVTLNNFSWIKDMNIKINSIVEVVRANDVIPCIKKVISNENTKNIEIPTICPCCGSLLRKKDKNIYCKNEKCSQKILNNMKFIVGKSCLDIEGMNDAVLKSLQLESVLDLFKITLEDLVNLKYTNGISLGESRANEIYNNIQYAKDNTESHIWFTTLGFYNIGKIIAKKLIDKFENIDNILNSSLSELTEVNSIGLQTALMIIAQKSDAKKIWNELKGIINIPQKTILNSKGSFSITGRVPVGYKNRDEYVKTKEKEGWVYHSTPKQDTDYLVIDDVNSNSSKAQKARKLNIKLVVDLP